MDILLAAQDILLYPFKLAKSRTAQRAYLSTVFLGFASLCLFGFAVIGYGVFYMNYVPEIGIEKVIHLQYAGDAGESLSTYVTTTDYPSGSAFLGDSIHAKQRYDVSVSLHLPTSPSNYELGNFMIDTELWTQDAKVAHQKGTLIARSSRPAILTYQSPLTYTMKTLLKAPLLLLGLCKEAEDVELKIMENVEFGKDSGKQLRRKDDVVIASGIPVIVNVKVLARKVQVYEVKVSFRAKLSGIRWLMYNHRIISFILFATTFCMMEMICAFLAWYFILDSFAKAWVPEKTKEKRYIRGDELRGTVSDLDLETEAEEYTEVEEEEEEEKEDTKGKKVDKTYPNPSDRGKRKVTARELGYPSPAHTPGPDAPGEIIEETKIPADYADDEEDDEASDETGEMVERPFSVSISPADAGTATDSGVGSSLSEAGTGRAAASTGRAGLMARTGALQRRKADGGRGVE